jgi:hypothetical protein
MQVRGKTAIVGPAASNLLNNMSKAAYRLGEITSDRPDGLKVSFMETEKRFSTLVGQIGTKLNRADLKACLRG